MEKQDFDDNLRIYLNDHLAGSTGGLQLAERARANSTDAHRTESWGSLCAAIEEDREVLAAMIDRLDFSQNRIKAALGWFAEKAGRLKPNGQMSGPSLLGQYLEAEMMMLGVTGKLSLWQLLKQIDDSRLRNFDLDGLIESAESQRDRLDQMRLELGPEVFSDRR